MRFLVRAAASGCEGSSSPDGAAFTTHARPRLPPAGRTHSRSTFAAQLAADAGLQRCLALRQGVCGWRLDPGVRPYRGYKLQDAPPEAEPFAVEPLNAEAGRHELAQLGIPVM